MKHLTATTDDKLQPIYTNVFQKEIENEIYIPINQVSRFYFKIHRWATQTEQSYNTASLTTTTQGRGDKTLWV